MIISISDSIPSSLDLLNKSPSQLYILFCCFLKITHWVHWELTTCACVWDHPLEDEQHITPKEKFGFTPKEKLFSSHLAAINYQITPHLGIKPSERLTYSYWNSDWINLVQVNLETPNFMIIKKKFQSRYRVPSIWVIGKEVSRAPQ